MNYTQKLDNKVSIALLSLFVKEKHHIHSASHHPRLLPGNWLPTWVR